MKNNNHLLLHEKYIHVNNYNGDKIQCEECGKVAESRISLINHVNAIHIQDYLVVCDICKLVSKNISSLRAHITRNHLIFKGKDKPQCKFCNAKFKYKVQLKNHLRSLNCIKLLPIKCEYCSKMFKNENTLSNHIWQYHTGSQVGKTFTCVDCDKKYMRRSDLAKHIRENHENRKPEKHKCPYCRSYFKARGILNAHIKYLHKRIDIFQCEHCEKNYSRPQHLKRHLKDTHLLKCDGKYYCRQCKVSYPNKLALNVHDCVAT
jgi:KRAB domain-containing zinc finger protein